MSYLDSEGVMKTSAVQDVSVTKAFSALLANGETVEAPDGTWFVAIAINGVPTACGNMTFTVKPYVRKTADAEKTYVAEQVMEYDASTGKPVEAGDR